jgi:8-oxo-dGTP pyrophosphatase MutT (NUDIX family)
MSEDLPEPEPQGWEGLPWPPKSPVGKPRAYGGVVIDPQGRLLLREVAGHFGGYVWSFAKGRPDGDESPRETALREVREEMGIDARILLPLPGTYPGTTTRSHFFLMTVEPREVDLAFASRETARLRWALPDEARGLLALTTDPVARKRDHEVLEAARAHLPAPLPLKRPVARREDWQTRLLPARRAQLAFAREFGPAEMARIARGFIPTVQEQKWFAYFEDGTLHLHRSWTGFAVYRVRFAPVPAKPGRWRIERVDVSRHRGQHTLPGEAEERAMLGDLVDNLLIGYGEEPAVDGFVLAALAAMQPGYLGNPKVVQDLIAPFLRAVERRLLGEGDEDAIRSAVARIAGAMTDAPAWVRMPWHDQTQLGASLVSLMHLDSEACERDGLAHTVTAALAAVRETIARIWEAHGCGRHIEDEADDEARAEVAAVLGRLATFVNAAFLGTASLLFRGVTLRDFEPGRER